MDRFPIAQIDRRSGKDQVRGIFGAKPLEDIRFKLRGAPKIHPLNRDFSRAFSSFKPYVLVFRLQKPTIKTELNSLKRLNIVLCTEIPAKYQYGETEEDLSLHPYEHIYVAEEYTTYLLLKGGRHKDSSDLKKDISFCEAFAEILTGILKVGENRQMYRELFPRDTQERDMIIRNDLDDPELEKLSQAKGLFSGLSEIELDFWYSVLKSKGKSALLEELEKDADIVDAIAKELNLELNLVREVYDGLYYEDYNSSTNLRFFKRLFEALHICVEDFNRNSFRQIDFAEYLRTEFDDEKIRLRRKFKSVVYVALKDTGTKEKDRFLRILEAYDNSSPRAADDINKDLELDIRKCFDCIFKNDPFKALGINYEKLVQHQDCDPDGEYAKNIDVLKRKIAETGGSYAGDIDAFLSASENGSLLYFGELEELVVRFDRAYSRPTEEERGAGDGATARKRKSITVNGVDLEYEEDDYKTLARNVEEDLKDSDYEIESHEPSRPEEKEAEGERHRGGGGGGVGKSKKQTKEIGFLGEKYVYEMLVRKYTKERVVWGSKYAKMMNVNPEGRDDLGYDMWYSDENGQRHYVEVKASKEDEQAFSISKAEVRFGEEHASSYEIILVLNVCSKNRRFIKLGKVFDYGEDESFNNNSKFKVETDDFRIKFELSNY